MKREKHHFANVVDKGTPTETPDIAKRAYELYEQRGRQDGLADQDWQQAESEIQKAELNK